MPITPDELKRLANPGGNTMRLLQIQEAISLILETGHIVGTDADHCTILQLKLDDWQLDQVAAFGAELADLEPEVLEDDGI